MIKNFIFSSKWKVRAAIISGYSTSSFLLSFFMNKFSFLEPSFEVLFSVNVNVNVIIKVSSNKSIDDDSNEE